MMAFVYSLYNIHYVIFTFDESMGISGHIMYNHDCNRYNNTVVNNADVEMD